MNVFFRNSLLKKSVGYLSFDTLAANAVPQIQNGNTGKFRLKYFFTHFNDIDTGFCHNTFSLGRAVKFCLVTKFMHVVHRVCIVAHPDRFDFFVMSYDIFKHPFWIAGKAISGVKNP